jgi:hypothetical protein
MGEKTLYQLRYPIQHGQCNTRDYTSSMALMNDLEAIWSFALETELNLASAMWKHYSVLLIIPDLFDKNAVKLMVDVLMNNMGFKSVCLQQVKRDAIRDFNERNHWRRFLARECIKDVSWMSARRKRASRALKTVLLFPTRESI